MGKSPSLLLAKYVDLLMPVFLIRTWDGFPRGREGQGLAWVKPNRLRDYAMPPADLPLIAPILDALN